MPAAQDSRHEPTMPATGNGIHPLREALLVSTAILLLATVSISLSYRAATTVFDHTVKSNLTRLAKAAATVIEGELLKTFHDPAQRSSPEFERVAAPMASFRVAAGDVQYIYTVGLFDSEVRFIVDPTPPGDADGDGKEDSSAIMEVYNDPDPALVESLTTGHATVSTEPYTDEWGTFLSGFAPVFDRSGQQVGAIGVDMNAAEYKTNLAMMQRAAFLGLVPSVLVSAIIGVGVFFSRHARLRNVIETENHRIAMIEQERETRKLAMIASRTDNGVVLTNARGEIEWTNDGFTRLTGWKLDEVAGRRPGQFLRGPQTDSEVVAHMRDQIRAQRGFRVEIVNYARDGRPFWSSVEVQPLFDESGVLTSFIGISADISARKSAEAATREILQRQTLMASGSKAGLWDVVMNPDDPLDPDAPTYYSPRLKEIFGYSENEYPDILGSWFSHIHRADVDRVRSAMLAHLSGTQPLDIEYRVYHRDAEIRWVAVSGQAIWNKAGRAVRMSGSLQDITARKCAEEETRHANARLSEALEREKQSAHQLELTLRELESAKDAADAANRAKSDFLANMSHEIRTPMTAILGYADLLVDSDASPADRIQHVNTIRRNGEHLLTIINDILDVSKIEAGRMSIENIACDPVSIIQEVANSARVRASDKNIVVRVVFENDLPRTIQSDPTRIRQIIWNLASNAIKFTDQGEVTVCARFLQSPTPRIEVDVVDGGIGMTPEESARLFRPFTQADTSMARRFGGTGLGLTISKRLAQMLGGDLDLLRSQPGAGSTFRLSVAAVNFADVSAVVDTEPAPASPPAPRPDNAADTVLAGKRILLAEDGPDNQRLIGHVLRKAGAEVTVVENGQLAVDEAFQAISRQRPYDLILTDMQMPIMDGYEATRTLRRIGYRGPIIALTAHAMSGDREKCIEAGCDDYATKPIDRRKLVATIQRSIEAPATKQTSIPTIA